MGAERRVSPRWDLDPVEVVHITCLDQYQMIAAYGSLIEASNSGFLLHLDRSDLLPKNLRSNLTLDSLVGRTLSIEIRQMNLDIIGRVVRTKPVGKGVFELAIDYTEDAPEYWRECLIDMLPKQPKPLKKAT